MASYQVKDYDEVGLWLGYKKNIVTCKNQQNIKAKTCTHRQPKHSNKGGSLIQNIWLSTHKHTHKNT